LLIALKGAEVIQMILCFEVLVHRLVG